MALVDVWDKTLRSQEQLGNTLDTLRSGIRQDKIDAMTKDDWEFKKAERERDLADKEQARSSLMQTSRPVDVTTQEQNPAYSGYTSEGLATAQYPQQSIDRNMITEGLAQTPEQNAQSLMSEQPSATLPLTKSITPHPIKAQIEAGKMLMASGNPLGQGMLTAAQTAMTSQITQMITMGDYEGVAKLYGEITGQTPIVTGKFKDQLQIKTEGGVTTVINGHGLTQDLSQGIPMDIAVQRNTSTIGEQLDKDKTGEAMYIHNRSKQMLRDKEYTNVEDAKVAASEEYADMKKERAQELKLTINPNNQTQQTSTPGIYFDKNTKEYKMNTDNGPITLNSEQVKNLNIEVKSDTPTQDIKNMQQSVPSVKSLIASTREDLKNVKAGPFVSRFQDVMTNKIGAPNPEFMKLTTDANLLYTRLMKMHVGSRGSEYMMKHFEKLINTGKQSPENLTAALDQMEQYANEISSGKVPALYSELSGGNKNSTLSVPPTPRKGYKIQQNKTTGEYREVPI